VLTLAGVFRDIDTSGEFSNWIVLWLRVDPRNPKHVALDPRSLAGRG
jgi:hypothetical protein